MLWVPQWCVTHNFFFFFLSGEWGGWKGNKGEMRSQVNERWDGVEAALLYGLVPVVYSYSFPTLFTQLKPKHCMIRIRGEWGDATNIGGAGTWRQQQQLPPGRVTSLQQLGIFRGLQGNGDTEAHTCGHMIPLTHSWHQKTEDWDPVILLIGVEPETIVLSLLLWPIPRLYPAGVSLRNWVEEKQQLKQEVVLSILSNAHLVFMAQNWDSVMRQEWMAAMAIILLLPDLKAWCSGRP